MNRLALNFLRGISNILLYTSIDIDFIKCTQAAGYLDGMLLHCDVLQLSIEFSLLTKTARSQERKRSPLLLPWRCCVCYLTSFYIRSQCWFCCIYPRPLNCITLHCNQNEKIYYLLHIQFMFLMDQRVVDDDLYCWCLLKSFRICVLNSIVSSVSQVPSENQTMFFTKELWSPMKYKN